MVTRKELLSTFLEIGRIVVSVSVLPNSFLINGSWNRFVTFVGHFEVFTRIFLSIMIYTCTFINDNGSSFYHLFNKKIKYLPSNSIKLL